MKHIVFVIGNYKNGGVAMHSTNLANAFAKNGYKVTLLVTREISADVYFNLENNVEVVLLSDYVRAHCEEKEVSEYLLKRKKTIRNIKRFRYITAFFKGLDNILAEKVRGIRISEALSVYAVKNKDAVYIPFGVSYYEATYYAVKPFGSKIIYAERNAPELEYPEDVQKKEKLIRLVSFADGVVLQTETEKDFYKGVLKNAVVINNPIKSDLPERFAGERRKVIVNFCRVSKQKNLPLLFDAMVKLHKEYPEYLLEIYGNTVEKQEEELCEEYRQYIKDISADRYIKILPPSGEIHSIVRDCAMFVSSSDFEGLSNSMIEALAIGLPCVCTDCLGGGARELITDGENGLLVPMQDPESLYLAIKRFIEDSALSEKCSQNAVKVRDTHSAEKIAGKWLRYIESVI